MTITHNKKIGDGRTGIFFPWRRRLMFMLLLFSLMLMIFGGLTSPVDEPYYYVLYWTFATVFLSVSILIGIYDIVKTYFETLFSYETSSRNSLQVDRKENLMEEKKMGS
ncbi:MAG: hypothetical protein LBU34_08590 [Planctomycetaceae bacterium]|jgi:uncharacterized ion transporter superfamily protein YfcC|nr:hypothetical protein [Planctomycetaceae bacterium]